MIELKDIWKAYPGSSRRKARVNVFRGLTLSIPPGVNVGILGMKGSGKSTLLRLLSGVDSPDHGVVCTGGLRVSWPVSQLIGIHNSLSTKEALGFLFRVLGVSHNSRAGKCEFVRELSGVGDQFDRPISSLKGAIRSRLGFCVTMAFDFDYYVVDEFIAGGDRQFREKAHEIMRERNKTSRLILASYNPKLVKEFSDYVYVLGPEGVSGFGDVEEGIRAYGQLVVLASDCAKMNGKGEATSGPSVGSGQDPSAAHRLRRRRRRVAQRRALASAESIVSAGPEGCILNVAGTNSLHLDAKTADAIERQSDSVSTGARSPDHGEGLARTKGPSLLPSALAVQGRAAQLAALTSGVPAVHYSLLERSVLGRALPEDPKAPDMPAAPSTAACGFMSAACGERSPERPAAVGDSSVAVATVTDDGGGPSLQSRTGLQVPSAPAGDLIRPVVTSDRQPIPEIATPQRFADVSGPEAAVAGGNAQVDRLFAAGMDGESLEGRELAARARPEVARRLRRLKIRKGATTLASRAVPVVGQPSPAAEIDDGSNERAGT